MKVVYCYKFCRDLEEYVYDARFFKGGIEYTALNNTLKELKSRFPKGTEFICYGRETTNDNG